MRSSSGHLEQQPAVVVEEVEGLVDEPAHPAPTGSQRRDPLLEQREVGHTVVVEGDHLAVDDRLAAGTPSIQPGGDRNPGKYVSASLPRRVNNRTLPSRTTASTR